MCDGPTNQSNQGEVWELRQNKNIAKLEVLGCKYALEYVWTII